MMKANANTTLVLLAMGFLAAGCATQKFAGIDEYKQLTMEATADVQAALHALDQVSANASHCTPKTVAAFEHDVQCLEVHSIRVRARARAIQARGDAYFACWSESITNITDLRVREAAERCHPELEASFSRIKLASQSAGAAFDSFSSGLQKLRVELEIKAGCVDSGADRELIQKTGENGQQVLKELGVSNSELLAMKKTLTQNPSKQAH